MVEKPYLSNSQLQMYERCGEAYRRSYIEGEKIPPKMAMLKGTGVHGASRVNFLQKIQTHKDLPKNDIVDAAVASYERGLSDSGVTLTQEEESVGYRNVVASAKDGVAIVAAVYADQVAPEYQPRFVEERHLIEIPSSPYNLMAVMDLADVRDIVADLKITSKKKSQGDVDTDEQLTFYSLVFHLLTGRLPAEVRFENLVDRVSAKKELRVTERNLLVGRRTADDCRSIANRINAMMVGLSKGVFIPANATSWWCSDNWCGYFRTCDYAIKSKKEG